MFTSILAFGLAFLKALPAICQVITAIGKHLAELDREHNEKTANERFTIKKQATQDFINAANVAANPTTNITGVSGDNSTASTTGQLSKNP